MQSAIGDGFQTSKMPGHWVLARLGKRVLRPGGLELTRRMLAGLGITRSDRVVELAPGMGVTARMTLSFQPASYTAIERDEAAAAVVRTSLTMPNAVCLAGTAEETGLPSSSATVVYGEAMLTMQRDDVKRRIVREVHRLLQRGGRYGIHEMSLLHDDAKQSVERSLSSVIHHGVRPLTAEEWRTLLEEEGFVVETVLSAPMRLLEAARLIRDEGVGGALRFGFNVLRDREARQRVLAMRNVFRAHRHDIAAISIIAVRA